MVALAAPLCFGPIQAGAAHPCASDAVARARELLAFFRHPDETGFAGQWSVGEAATNAGTVKALTGPHRYDVLEVWGHVYKGRYRMRLIYAVVGGTCVLMGQEIIEDAVL